MKTHPRALPVLSCLLLIMAAALLCGCSLYQSEGNSGGETPSGSTSGSATAGVPAATLADIQIAGTEGEEPTFVIPKNLQVSDESYHELRPGTGAVLTNQDVITFHLQRVALDNHDAVYSSWGSFAEGEEMTIDLTDGMSEFVPPQLRELLLNAKVGSVIVYKTTAERSELGSEPESVEVDGMTLTPYVEGQDELIEQLWIITVIKVSKASSVSTEPGA